MPKLRPYQKADAIKLAKLKSCACLNEQRTGKTPTALAISKLQHNKRVLIICPGIALYNWKEQYETWLKEPCIVLDGTPKQRAEKLKNWTHGLVITFDTLKLINRKTSKNSNKTTKTGELLHILKFDIDAVIVDEFHRARNRKTLTTKALFKLIPKIPHKIALTGTPAYAKNEDIWTMLHFLYPNLFPNYWEFIQEYFETRSKWTPNGNAQEIIGLKPEKEIKLQNFLNLISTQRKQHDKDVMPWLPEKPIPHQIKLPASAQQQKHLEHLMEYFETDTVICKQPIDRLIRYRQICQDPRLLNLKGESAKTNWINQYYKDLPDKPTIIFSMFTSYLKLLAQECPYKHALITGETTPKERREIETAFQQEKINILFINVKAGKESLTLDRAESMIFLDKFPPAGDISQASERFTATSECRKNIPKDIYELIIKDSYDEQIYQAVSDKQSTTEVLNNFIKYIGQ